MDDVDIVPDAELNRSLASQTAPFVERSDRSKRRRPWQHWIDADLGFREYWYPALRTQDLPADGCTPVKVLGEEILVVRKNGKLFAIENRCAHRGARFSERPLVLSDDTITCWYHTWTYGLDDGRLRCILNDPDTALVGKVGVRSYAITEAKGLIFTYIGDEAPPPLERDVPPTFLDEDVAIFISEPGLLDADWRLCLENAFDPGHHFIHNWSPFIAESGFPMTFGYVASRGREKDDVDFHLNGTGPVGFSRCTQTADLIFEATIPDKDGNPSSTFTAPNAVGKSREALVQDFMNMPPITVNIWLPCMNTVYNFPGTLLYYEWCVPEETGKTRYFIAGGKRVANEQERESWLGQEGHDNWEVPVVENFFAQDNEARESMQKFYSEEEGWYRERLYRPDLELTMFRKFFADHGGVIQTREATLHRM